MHGYRLSCTRLEGLPGISPLKMIPKQLPIRSYQLNIIIIDSSGHVRFNPISIPVKFFLSKKTWIGWISRLLQLDWQIVIVLCRTLRRIVRKRSYAALNARFKQCSPNFNRLRQNLRCAFSNCHLTNQNLIFCDTSEFVRLFFTQLVNKPCSTTPSAPQTVYYSNTEQFSLRIK